MSCENGVEWGRVLGADQKKSGLGSFPQNGLSFSDASTHSLRNSSPANRNVLQHKQISDKVEGCWKIPGLFAPSECMVAPTCSQHQKWSRSIQPARKAWFSSTCYHASLPPHALTRPREFGTFFLLGGLFPIPGAHRKRQLPPRGGGAPREPQIQQY